MAKPGITVQGTGSYAPERRIHNTELEDALNLPAGWIEAKTGILERRRAADYEATSDLAVHAARNALDMAGIDPIELDMIIVGTSTPDFPLPATASLVQRDLRAHRAFAFDLNVVCSSFVYALDVARALLAGHKRARYALVIGADTYSRILNYKDKRTCVLFGDGAGAVVLTKSDGPQTVDPAQLKNDGRLWNQVLVPAGGSRLPADLDTLMNDQHYFQMDGRAVKTFVQTEFPRLIEAAAQRSGHHVNDFDHIICHQANGHLLEACREALGLPAERLHRTVDHFGNTGAASIPLTLDLAYRSGKVKVGDRVVLITFGGGMSCGAIGLTWTLPQLPQPLHTPQPVALRLGG